MMKKNTILKVLSLAMVLVMVVAAVLLTSCGNSKELQDTQDKLDAAIADISAAEAKITKIQNDIAALTEGSVTKDEQAKLEQKVDDLAKSAATAEALAQLEEEIEALTNVDNETKAELRAQAQQLAEAAKELSDLKETVKELREQSSGSMNEAAFKEATEVLFDDENPLSIAAFKAGIIRHYLDARNSNEANEIAIQYENGDIDEYAAKADYMAQKLLRATSIADIQATFAARDAEFEALKTIVEKFEEALQAKEPARAADGSFITGTGKLGFPSLPAYEHQMDELERLYDLIEARELEITDEQDERYGDLQDAVERLGVAEAADDDIYDEQDEMGLGADDTLYLKDDPTGERLGTIKGRYDEQVAPMFTDEEDTIYYAVSMEDLPGYQNYLAKLARYNELAAALNAFRSIYPQMIYSKTFKTTDPLYSDFASLKGQDGAAMDGWKKAYKLVDFDETTGLNDEYYNVAYIVGVVDGENANQLGGYHRVVAVKYFAYTLNALYENVVNVPVKDASKNLPEQIDVEVEGGYLKVLYTRIPTLDDIRVKQTLVDSVLANLAETGVSVEDENGEEHVFKYAERKVECINKMLSFDDAGADRAALEAIYARVDTLKAVKAHLDALVAQIKADLGVFDNETGEFLYYKVSFGSSKAIYETYPNARDGYFAAAGIAYDVNDEETNTENYEEMTEEINGILAELDGLFTDLKAKVQAIYDAVKDLINVPEAETFLPVYYRVIDAQAKVIDIVGGGEEDKFIIDDVNFFLTDENEEGGKISFQEFWSRLTTKVTYLVNQAVAADAASDALRTSITNIGEYNLNKTETVDTVTANFIAWAEAYLGKRIEEQDADEYLASLADYFVDATLENEGILGIDIYNKANAADDRTYTFIPADVYQTLVDTHATRTARWNEAQAAWAEVNMTPDANEDAMDASFEAFIGYVKEYYTNDLDEFEAVKAFYFGEYEFTVPMTNDEKEMVNAKMNTETLQEKAARYASYMTAPQFEEDVAYTALNQRYEDYKAIIDATTALAYIYVPAEVAVEEDPSYVANVRTAVSALLAKIKAYRTAYVYEGAITGKGYDADLVAYKTAAKVCIIEAFQAGDLKAEVVTAQGSYNIEDPTDRDTVKQIYCVNMIDASNNKAQVDGYYEVFRTQALIDATSNPFDFAGFMAL